MITTFIEGALAGFAYVMPIGAQNIFLIHSSIKLGAPKHLRVAAYVFFADLSLAFLCFFGIGTILTSSFFLRVILSILGSIVLFMLGYKLISSKGVQEMPEDTSGARYLRTALMVTYANPQAIIDGALIYGALRTTYTVDGLSTFFLGNVAASILWFGGLSTLVAIFRSAQILSNIKWVEKICGTLMIFMGMKVLWVVFRSVYVAP